jgi:hypothetical protein
MTAPVPDPGALLDRLEEARKAATEAGPLAISDGWDLAVAHKSQGVVLFDAAIEDAMVTAYNALPDLIRLARDGLALRAEVERLVDKIDKQLWAIDPNDLAKAIRAVVADTSGEGQ